MRRLLTWTLAAASLILLTPGGSSSAEPDCQVTDPQTGKCLIQIEVPGGPGGDGPKDTGSGSACYWDGTSQGVTKPPPGPVSCTSKYGYWSNSYHCYISPVDPQPPASDPAWRGHRPGDGAVYSCFQPQTDIDIYIWSQAPPPGSGTGPTPRDVALLAIDSMNLHAIDVGIAPKPGPNSIGLVGMPVWMWAANPGSSTYGPSTASASAGGMSITATARVHQITWDMGDNTEVVCRSAGTPYKASLGRSESPDCGHVYERSSFRETDKKYTVTATSDWVVTWEGAGQSGTIRLNGLQRSVEVAIGEGQVLVK